MTKKVLISEDDMVSLWHSAVEICAMKNSPFKTVRPHMTKEDFQFGARIFEYVLNQWVDSQPTAVETINDRVIYINPYYTTIRIPIGSYVEFLGGGGGGGSGGKGLSKIESAHSGE